jgi:hypothetical protein
LPPLSYEAGRQAGAIQNPPAGHFEKACFETKTTKPMKRTKITDIKKVQAFLDEGQGSATARILASHDIETLAAYGEKRLEELGLAKSYRAGATAHYYPPQVPNSYKYPADGTYATITRGSSGWYLTDVHRGQTGSRSYGASWRRAIKLTAAQQIQLINASDLYTDVTALPNSAFENQLRWRLQQDPKLLASLQVTEKTLELHTL